MTHVMRETLPNRNVVGASPPRADDMQTITLKADIPEVTRLRCYDYENKLPKLVAKCSKKIGLAQLYQIYVTFNI